MGFRQQAHDDCGSWEELLPGRPNDCYRCSHCGILVGCWYSLTPRLASLLPAATWQDAGFLHCPLSPEYRHLVRRRGVCAEHLPFSAVWPYLDVPLQLTARFKLGDLLARDFLLYPPMGSRSMDILQAVFDTLLDSTAVRRWPDLSTMGSGVLGSVRNWLIPTMDRLTVSKRTGWQESVPLACVSSTPSLKYRACS